MWSFAHFEGKMLAQMWLFAHLRVKCLHNCGWFFMKTMIYTFVGCLHISRQNWTFAHLTALCLHISGWCIFYRFAQFCGRRVCTNVVVCTFEGEMFAQMWLFAHFVVFAHFTAPQGLSLSIIILSHLRERIEPWGPQIRLVVHAWS